MIKREHIKRSITFIMVVITAVMGIFVTKVPEEAFATKKKVALKKITVSRSYLEIKEGKTKKLKVKYKPKNTTVKKKVIWKSSKPKIASVKNGVVTAKTAGEAVITVKVGKKKAKCVVYVIAKDGYVNVDQAYELLNKFRTSKNVWIWNPDNRTKTYFNTSCENTLQPLERNDDLEHTARIRAKEISKIFSHTRPDGSICFTAYPEDIYAGGENIAYGQPTCESVTEAWKETGEYYDGQGHRRNMLEYCFTSVGIAGYRKDGVIYWVQSFGGIY